MQLHHQMRGIGPAQEAELRSVAGRGGVECIDGIPARQFGKPGNGHNRILSSCLGNSSIASHSDPLQALLSTHSVFSSRNCEKTIEACNWCKLGGISSLLQRRRRRDPARNGAIMRHLARQRRQRRTLYRVVTINVTRKGRIGRAE